MYLRAEYLVRRTQMALGEDPLERFRYGPGPDGIFDDYFLKHGFYAELEAAGRPTSSWSARCDGLRRKGNVVGHQPAALRERPAPLHRRAPPTACPAALRLKASGEVYDFSDFEDEIAVHLGIAGPF